MTIEVTFLRNLDNGRKKEQPGKVASQLADFINAAQSSLHIAVRGSMKLSQVSA